MKPLEKAKEMLIEHDYTIDNYANCGIRKDHAFDLKHEVLMGTCREIIKVCERLNVYEIPFWEKVIDELNTLMNKSTIVDKSISS